MGEERRRPGGRQRPYIELRIMAKVYAVLAPLGGAAVLFAGVFSLLGQPLPFYLQLLGMVLVVIGAFVYYIILKAGAQFIYILFDIAASASRIRELIERPEGKTP